MCSKTLIACGISSTAALSVMGPLTSCALWNHCTPVCRTSRELVDDSSSHYFSVRLNLSLGNRPRAAALGLSMADRARVRNREIGFIFQSFNLIGASPSTRTSSCCSPIAACGRPSASSGSLSAASAPRRLAASASRRRDLSISSSPARDGVVAQIKCEVERDPDETGGMKSRVHPKYKTKYRVRNRASYERALIGRGNITIWLSRAAIRSLET